MPLKLVLSLIGFKFYCSSGTDGITGFKFYY